MTETSNVTLVRGPQIPSLRRWGLSADADLVYRALMLSGAATPGQLARDLGLATRRAGTAVEELAAAGAVRRVLVGLTRRNPAGKDSAWQALAPERVLALLRQRRSPVPDAWERVRRHVGVVSGLQLPEKDTTQFRLRHLASRPLARRRVAELVAAERHEHLAINTEQVFSAETVAAALPLDRDRQGRGVPTRVLGLPPIDGDAGCPSAEELSGLSSEYRERPALPVKLMVFDRSVAIVPVDPLNFERGFIEVAEPAAVAILVQLFYRQWAGAHDPRRTGVPRIVLSPREKAVVTVLASGRTDDHVAQQLNLSRRTIVTTVSGLMDRLGVENRFQLGLALGAATDLRIPHGDRPEQRTR